MRQISKEYSLVRQLINNIFTDIKFSKTDSKKHNKNRKEKKLSIKNIKNIIHQAVLDYKLEQCDLMLSCDLLLGKYSINIYGKQKPDYLDNNINDIFTAKNNYNITYIEFYLDVNIKLEKDSNISRENFIKGRHDVEMLEDCDDEYEECEAYGVIIVNFDLCITDKNSNIKNALMNIVKHIGMNIKVNQKNFSLSYNTLQNKNFYDDNLIYSSVLDINHYDNENYFYLYYNVYK